MLIVRVRKTRGLVCYSGFLMLIKTIGGDVCGFLMFIEKQNRLGVVMVLKNVEGEYEYNSFVP